MGCQRPGAPVVLEISASSDPISEVGKGWRDGRGTNWEVVASTQRWVWYKLTNYGNLERGGEMGMALTHQLWVWYKLGKG